VNRIRILPESVANKIAAGEVVERPASACKELVENAIDAGGTQIRIDVRGGGRSLIRVTDNGCGMSRDDALLSLERHATSKIKTAVDIDRIETLGFRGEAIPSLAAVSRFRLVTRESDALEGTEIEADGGKIRAVRAAGCPAGTQVEMRQLFFNVPARKKFLRSEQTELARIHQMGILYALAHPRIHFSLRHNDRLLFEAPPVKELRERVIALYGREVAQQLVPVEMEGRGIRIAGLTAKPGFTRANRREMHFFVNRRPVDSRAIHYGVLEGYHNALMRESIPSRCSSSKSMQRASMSTSIQPSARCGSATSPRSRPRWRRPSVQRSANWRPGPWLFRRGKPLPTSRRRFRWRRLFANRST
jgi:DNA mismatch repair protein MutL